MLISANNEDAAKYIEDIAGELKLIATYYELPVVAYLLAQAAEGAREECEKIIEKRKVSPARTYKVDQ